MSSTLTLTHKIVRSVNKHTHTRKREDMYRIMVTPYPYHTRRAADQEVPTWEGTVRGTDRTAMTLSTFKYQSIKLYNRIPVALRNYWTNSK